MEIKLKITGITPLVMHNPQLANPANEWAKRLADLVKEESTESNLLLIADVEWCGGIYWDEELGLHLPSSHFKRSFEESGKMTKEGRDVNRAVTPLFDKCAIEHDGPTNFEKLKANALYRWTATVGIQRKKIMRTRPIFRKWGTIFAFDFQEDIMNLKAVMDIAEKAGRVEGVGDARRLGYGRYKVEQI